jgi:DNA-binding response OmpR family regulator
MYQTLTTVPPADPVRVLLVLEVPAGAVELTSRVVRLADEYGDLIARSVPGVRNGKAAAITAPSPGADPARVDAALAIDRARRTVHVDGTPVRLAYREFELLRYLADRPGRPVSRAELVGEVWRDRPPGVPLDASLRTVDTHVRRLRSKLGRHAGVLITVRGRGYQFNAEVPPIRTLPTRSASPPRRAAR